MNDCTALQRVLLFVSALLFSLAPSAFASKQDSVPGWVRAAASETIPKYSPETNAVVLLEQTTYTVAPDGTATEHYRHVLKILRPQGREQATVVVPFDKDSKLLSLHVWSIAPDGHEYALKDKEIVQYGNQGDDILYDDLQFKVGKAPGADPGGIVAYECEQRRRPYINEATWFFQGDLPQLNQSFTLELPPGYTYTTVWTHHDPINAVELEHQRWRWEIKETSAIDLNQLQLHPNVLALSGRMTLHYGVSNTPSAAQESWKSIGEWYALLAKDRLVASPDIAAKAKELAVGKDDFYDKSEPIAEFVQKQVRYVAIELGIGGQQPHFASEIFRYRYGDCKDKATLLSAMLSTVGVHSTLMIVDHRRGVVDPDTPSTYSDHAIAAIEIPNGYDSPKLKSVITTKSGRRYLIFDPTSEKTVFGQLEHQLQGGFGLLVEGSDSEIVALPVLSPELNTIRRTGRFQLQSDGSLTGKVTEKRFGDVSEARRKLYLADDVKQQGKFLDHQLAQDFTTYNVTDFKVENADALNKDLTTTFSMTADGFGKNMGALLMVRPRVLGSEGLHVDHEKRTIPIDLQETLQATDDFEIALPSGYAVDEVPNPVKLDLGFASYESSSSVKGNVLHYTRTYTVRQVSLPSEKYKDLEKLVEVIGADEQSRAVLKKQ